MKPPVDLIPEYYEDDLAKKYSAMLYKGQIDYQIEDYLIPHQSLISSVYDSIYDNLCVARDEHNALISWFPTIGLIGL